MDRHVRDVFVKVANVFPNDVYLIHNRYMIGGILTNEKNKAFYVAEVNSPTKELLDKEFDEGISYYIPSIRDFKKYETGAEETSHRDEFLVEVLKNVSKNMDDFNNNSIHLRSLFSYAHPEDVYNFFDDNQVVIFDVPDIEENGIHGVFLGKDFFPLITKTNSKGAQFYCKYNDVAKLYDIAIRYETVYFTVHIFSHFIDLHGTGNNIRCAE